jgi:hypothetical protein
MSVNTASATSNRSLKWLHENIGRRSTHVPLTSLTFYTVNDIPTQPMVHLTTPSQ